MATICHRNLFHQVLHAEIDERGYDGKLFFRSFVAPPLMVAHLARRWWRCFAPVAANTTPSFEREFSQSGATYVLTYFASCFRLLPRAFISVFVCVRACVLCLGPNPSNPFRLVLSPRATGIILRSCVFVCVPAWSPLLKP